MEEGSGNLPRVVSDVMPPVARERDSYLRLFLSRAEAQGAVRYTRVEQWEIVPNEPARIAAKPSFARLAFGAVALVATTALVTWWLTDKPPSPPRDSGVTVALAPAKKAPPPSAPKAPAAAAPAAKVTAVAAIAPTPAAAVPPSETSATPRTEKAALARAFATNESWPWVGSETRGMVVVGPGEIAGGRLCRNVAIMTRGDGIPDRTANMRKCQEPGGAIVDAETSGG